MLPLLIGVGLVMRGVGQMRANMDQAAAEEGNANFYAEQAEFARATGERQGEIFQRETGQLMGQISSAYAKAGTDTNSNAGILAVNLLYRQQESFAIKKETEMNVRLAMLRAENARKNAENLRDSTTNFFQVAGSVLGGLGSMK